MTLTALAQDQIHRFQDTVFSYYRDHKRILPWREEIHPFGVVVSEVMLQQTQVARVLEVYPRFLVRFPSFHALANSTLEDVLTAWQGMGYNRRAKYLRLIAQTIENTYHGILPSDPQQLDELPGIGPATACSIATFAFNHPHVFIETNIRRVFLHHFFPGIEQVADQELLPLISQTLPQEDPRSWYYALMDYGAHLGKTIDNPNKKSKHYTIQSTFSGSRRQLRGIILKMLLAQKSLSREMLMDIPSFDSTKIDEVLLHLTQEGMIYEKGNKYTISRL
jgi:A/G-specific adenine glycosylase